MIQARSFSAGYSHEPVIKSVDLDINAGEVLVIVGPNGSGKSTLLKAIIGFLDHCQGQVFYDGVDMKTMTPKQIARKATFLTQSRNTPSISAFRMVLHGRFPYLSYPRKYGKEDFKIAKASMEATKSDKYADRLLGELSGGERQSVYLAMALAQKTEYVFMDEPTTYLDIHRQLQMIEMAKCLAKEGKAVVLVVHDLSQALQIADRIAVMEAGELVGCGTPKEIFDSGILNRVFNVSVRRVDTADGPYYYCVPEKGDV